MIVISDTSAITNLAAIDQLNLLTLLYGKVIIPEAVYRELVDIDPPVPGGVEVQTVNWLEVRLIANREVFERLQGEMILNIVNES